jgi:hypothetical protein
VSLSTLPPWLGNRYPSLRNASPKGFRAGKIVWQVMQLVSYFLANEGTAPAVRIDPNQTTSAAVIAARTTPAW